MPKNLDFKKSINSNIKQSSLVILLSALSTIANAANNWSEIASQLPVDSIESYTNKYPLYAEITAHTTYQRFDPGNPNCPVKSREDFNKLPEKQKGQCLHSGGKGGHGSVFLRGACLVKGSPYPQLYDCSENADVLNNPDSGVGISLNKMFYNLNWVGLEGRSLYYYGSLMPQDNLDANSKIGIIQKVLSSGYYQNFKMNPEYLNSPDRPPHLSEVEYLVNQSLGTDYGIALGRAVFFTRTPINRQQLHAAIKYLNELNQELFENYEAQKGVQYYTVVLNNCAHTSHNVFHKMGFLPQFKKIKNFGESDYSPEVSKIEVWWQIFLSALGNDLATPGNSMLNLSKKMSKGPPDILNLFSSKKLQGKLQKQLLPTGLGTVVGFLPFHNNNEIFVFGDDPLVASLPPRMPISLLNPKRHRDNAYSKEIYYKIEENQDHYQNLISRRLEQINADLLFLKTWTEHHTVRQLPARQQRLSDIAANERQRLKFIQLAQQYKRYLMSSINLTSLQQP